MKNADYDVIEKSELEIPATFEGSGVTDDDGKADAVENVDSYDVVDDNFEQGQEEEKEEGSSEFWVFPGNGIARLKFLLRTENRSNLGHQNQSSKYILRRD